MRRPTRGAALWLAALSLPAVQAAYAEVYLTPEQALAAMFPGRAATAVPVTLTPEEADRVQKLSGESVQNKALRLWKVGGAGWMFVDVVVGKHDFITYALGLTPQGKVTDLEVLEYKETFGRQVMEKQWRSQFTGKGEGDPLTVGKDIKNYSGATLSSTHITRGVKRLVATYAVIQNRLP